MARDSAPEEKKLSWWRRFTRMFKKNTNSEFLTVPEPYGMLQDSYTTLTDWRQALDQLQPLVRAMRNEIDSLEIKELTFDILGAGTFLLQIDLLLIKIRQHFNNFERRKRELSQDPVGLKESMNRVDEACQRINKIILMLYNLLSPRTYRDLNHHEIINHVHSLESETKILSEAMQVLNDVALKRDPLYQLFEAELLRTLTDLKSSASTPNAFSPNTLNEPSAGPLRTKANRIVHPERRQIGFCFISCYESLKRCSALFAHKNITQLMDLYRKQLELFLRLSGETEGGEEAIEESLLQLFHTVDAMRFAPVKGFSDKAKLVKKQMKQGLEHTPLGQAYLRTVRMSPRAKLSLKDKFRN